ncbi:hypothetical protein Fmac_031942 [Flemingia macrophylla]|uniref:ACT domain-containing protein ACR n=1 Tax=Flemingia macrophylla TaxID=520843 RepID=A0ABD1L3I2_9FABA
MRDKEWSEREDGRVYVNNLHMANTYLSSCGPVEGDVLYLQDRHISQHIWNKAPDRSVRVRQSVPSFQDDGPATALAGLVSAWTPPISPIQAQIIEKKNSYWSRLLTGGTSVDHPPPVDSVNRQGLLLEVVQILTDMNLQICKSYISSDAGWFMDGAH